MRLAALILVALLALPLRAATSTGDTRPPKVKHRVYPRYTYEARRARVQGTVVFDVEVDETGKPGHITLLSPLGFGLDERAYAALQQYRFQPATKEGRPVKACTNVEIVFRSPRLWYDAKAERRRADFNVALARFSSNDRDAEAEAVKTFQRLADQKFPAGMFMMSRLLAEGRVVPKDEQRSLQLVRDSAGKNYGPAVYAMGVHYVTGRLVEQDVDQGIRMIREASVMGSVEAQKFLGDHYRSGKILPKDPAEARRYYRLCAASGSPQCQFALGRMLLETPGRSEREFVQALSWLQLAADAGSQGARRLLESEAPGATPEQIAWAQKLKPQLLRR